ncbi:MAG TPA: preprotein translocase subunit SecG [Lichenihabitans sp.]|jgi:preprotein translocase subunit SecG|nr:preprotein translocase subunit SecG [Lichenihabitans sp.]
MQTVLIVFHLMVVVALVGVVLLQRSEGGALGVGGGGGFMTGRGQANALTRATAILAALFFATSLGLTLLANYSRAPKSIIDTAPATAPHQSTAPAPSGSNPLEQLKKMEDQKPAAPATPPGPEVPNSQ